MAPTPTAKTTGNEEWKGAESVPLILGLLDQGVPIARIARRLGVSRQTIYTTLEKAKSPAVPKNQPGNTSHTDAEPKDTASETAA